MKLNKQPLFATPENYDQINDQIIALPPESQSVGYLISGLTWNLACEAQRAAQEDKATSYNPELYEAYIELWTATEDGIDSDRFFQLREKFREIQTLMTDVVKNYCITATDENGERAYLSKMSNKERVFTPINNNPENIWSSNDLEKAELMLRIVRRKTENEAYPEYDIEEFTY